MLGRETGLGIYIARRTGSDCTRPRLQLTIATCCCGCAAGEGRRADCQGGGRFASCYRLSLLPR